MARDPLTLPPVDGQPVHFQEAIRAAEARHVVLPDIYYGQLQGVARQLAFTIAGIASHDQLKAVMDSLSAYQGNGKTFAQWQREIVVKDLGLPKYRLGNIFRTNLQSNYQAGHWEQFERNQQRRPYLMYDAINDSRTRPTHRALDGLIRPVDDPIWRRIAPLNGYLCRCGLISLTEAQAKARSGNGEGLNKAYDAVTMQPDKGWDTSPKDRLHGIEQATAKRLEKGGVLSSALDNLLAQDMKIIEIPGFNRVQEKMTDLAKLRPEWFPLGFNGIHAVGNPELFAGFDRDKALFYVSATDELMPGFNPAQALQEAMAKIARGEALSFNNEYAVETVWHEIVHGITGISAARLAINRESVEEGIVQLAARHSYHRFNEALGAAAIHQQAIIKNGLAYPIVAKNLLHLFQSAGLDGKLLLERLTNNQWKTDLIQSLAKGLGTRVVLGKA